MRDLMHIIGLALLLGSQPVFSSEIETVSLHADRGINLVYQLDCVSGFIRCTRDAVGPAADQLTADDRTLLGLWRDLRRTVPTSAPAAPVNSLALPTPASLANFSSRQTAWSPATDWSPSKAIHQQQLRQSLLDYFSPAFESDWDTTRAPHLQRLRYNLSTLFQEQRLSASLGRSAAFLGQHALALPDVQLIAITGNTNGSLATLDSEFAYIETPLGERATDRAPVIVHEFVHHWLASMNEQDQHMLVDAFLNQKSECAITAYHLFEEVIATAVANGHIERLLLEPVAFDRYLSLPGSFYADLDIDRMAKAMLPLVSRYIDKSMAIDTDFINAYTAMADAMLGDRCDALSGQLRSNAFLLTSGLLQPARELMQRRLGSTTTFVDIAGDREPADWYLKRYPGLSGVVAATLDELPALRALLPETTYTKVATLAARHHRVVYGWRRSLHSTVYIVVGRDTEGTAAAMTQFVALNTTRFDGVWLPPALPLAATRAAF